MERPQYQGNTPREAVTAASYVPPELLIIEGDTARVRKPNDDASSDALIGSRPNSKKTKSVSVI